MQYGLNFVMGNFGAGKTFGTYLDLFDLDRSENYIISNVPYSIVDYYFSTADQLINVFDVLERYMYDTNQDLENYFNISGKQKDIILVVDEAQIYLGARESLTKASILNRLKLVLTQCRKRKIKVFFITQRLSQVDIYVRRLSDFVVEYHRKSFLNLITRVKKTTYENKGDVADIESDNITKISGDGEVNSFKDDAKLYSEFFSPLTTFLNIFSFFSSTYRRILKEEFMTYHIVGYVDETVPPLTLDLLLDGLYANVSYDEKRNLKYFHSVDIEQKPSLDRSEKLPDNQNTLVPIKDILKQHPLYEPRKTRQSKLAKLSKFSIIKNTIIYKINDFISSLKQ